MTHMCSCTFLRLVTRLAPAVAALHDERAAERGGSASPHVAGKVPVRSWKCYGVQEACNEALSTCSRVPCAVPRDRFGLVLLAAAGCCLTRRWSRVPLPPAVKCASHTPACDGARCSRAVSPQSAAAKALNRARHAARVEVTVSDTAHAGHVCLLWQSKRCMLPLQMLHAVTYLHQQDVWHRDLKSSNVLMSHMYGQRIIKVHCCMLWQGVHACA